MKHYILACALSAGFASAIAQTNLEVAEIEAFRLSCPETLITGALHQIDSTSITSHGAADISRALNVIPGVKMETRGEGGSRRIHVRGSSLRSPYSIRNSMLIVDGFIFTEADGNSPIEWLDPNLISSINVVTGPAAASYGGAYGGAFVVETNENKRYVNESTGIARMATTGVPDSYFNYQAYNMLGGLGNGSYALSICNSENPGYRDWEWNNKSQLYFKAKFYGAKNVKHTIIAGLYDGRWALPGAIKEEDASINPMSSPGAGYNAHVDRMRTLGGYSVSKEFESGSTLSASILGRYTLKSNPYGTSTNYNGYKEEDGMGMSAYIRATKNIFKRDDLELNTETSAIILFDKTDLREWDFAPSALTVIPPKRYDLTLDANQAFLSSSLILTNNSTFRVEAQLGLNSRNRHTHGLTYESDTLFLTSIVYDSESNNISFLPRLGASYMLSDNLTVFTQMSTGFSDPTSFELVDPETFVPAELKSEEALGLELGFRYQFGEKLQLRNTLYHQTVNNAIMGIVEDGYDTFMNVEGGLVMSGLETEIAFTPCRSIFIRGYGTFTMHKFGEESEFDGNAIPGTPGLTGGLQLRYIHDLFNLNVEFRHIGENPILNDNSVYAEAYSLLDPSVEVKINNKYVVQAGVRNALNTQYSDWLHLNAGWSKYYNPAPPRTAYISARFTF